MKNKKQNANQKIKAAMAGNERRVLKNVQYGMQQGVLWNHFNYGAPSTPTYNAVDRLVAAGKIKYSRARFGYVLTAKGERELRVA